MIGLESSDYSAIHHISVPWETWKYASKIIRHVKQYQHFQEIPFIALPDFLFMNFALIILLSKFIIFTDDNSVINLITHDE